MKVFHGLNSLSEPFQNSVVAIGVFDGVHLGHQAILKQTAKAAAAKNFTPVVLTFDINPEQLFAPERAALSLTSLPQRSALIDLYGGGIESVVVAKFDQEFAALTPEQFISEILIGKFAIKHAFVGTDFRFGKGRAGNVQTLTEAGVKHGFEVTAVSPITVNDLRASSTEIRKLISEGDIPPAEEILGHAFTIEGMVVTGKQLGRELGYPTANIAPLISDQLLPADGIYAGFVTLPSGKAYRSAISIGTNPTTDTGRVRKLEVYIMDGFDQSIYGQQVSVGFKQKIRDTIKFDGLDTLKNQIADDVEVVGKLLAHYVV